MKNMTNTPKKSVVQVHFDKHNVTLAYYNDQFDLQVGDMVYVEGRMSGLLGRVTEVSYSFKIKLSDYKKVISLVDTSAKGQFFMAGSHFVTFDREALPKSKAITWFKSPENDEEEFVTGSEGETFTLDNLKGFVISPEIAERGHEYYVGCKVRYLCLDGNKGYAIVEGTRAYEVDFEYQDGEISGLVCDCFCGYNCKHEFAAMLQLRETLRLITKHYENEYKQNDYFVAIAKGTLFLFAIYEKETGALAL